MDNLELLKSLGFTLYEARTYAALAELGASTAKEISIFSKLPKNKTYEMLRRLEEKNMIASLPVTPRKFKISDIKKLNEYVEQEKRSLRNVEDNLKRFIEQSSKPKLGEYKEVFWILRGKQAIMEKMAAQNLILEKESLSLNSLSYAGLKNLRTMKQAIERSVKIKMIVPVKNNLANMRKVKEIGVEIREYDEKKFGPFGIRFSVFDRKTVRITFGEPEVRRLEDYLTLWSESPYLANIMRSYFMEIWVKSKEICI